MCLNARLLFEPIKAQAKKDGDVCPESITEYLCFLVNVQNQKMHTTN